MCELLERYLGVRWLMPGADGDDVPAARTIHRVLQRQGLVEPEPRKPRYLISLRGLGYRFDG